MLQGEHRTVGGDADRSAHPRKFRRIHRRGRLWLAFALCAAALLYAAAAAAADIAPPAATAASTLPPLVEPATRQHFSGKVIWLDRVTPDLARAERFYSALLGWSFQAAQIGGRHLMAASAPRS